MRAATAREIGLEPTSDELEFNEGDLYQLGGFLSETFSIDETEMMEAVDEFVTLKREEDA